MAITLSLNSQNLEHQIGGNAPSVEDITIDFGGVLSEQYPYEQVRLKYYVSEPWLSIFGDNVIDNEIDSSGTSATVSIGFNALDSLPVGNNSAIISFIVEGMTYFHEQERWQAVDSFDHYIYMNVLAAVTISTDKFIHEIAYLKNNNTFSGDTLITLLNNASAENCSVELSQSVQYFAIEDASFSTSTHIIAGADLAQLATATANPIGILAALKNSAGTTIANFSLKVAILENDDITANISSAEFELVKSKAEVKTQKFNLSNPSGNHSLSLLHHLLPFRQVLGIPAQKLP